MNNITLEQLEGNILFETIYSDFYVTEADQSEINMSQFSLTDIESYKVFVQQYSNIIAKGQQASQFLTQLKQNVQQQESDQMLVILDRTCDPISPMTYKLNYASMCELLGLGFDSINYKVPNNSSQQIELKLYYDMSWKELYYQSLDTFGDKLNKIISECKQKQEAFQIAFKNNDFKQMGELSQGYKDSQQIIQEIQRHSENVKQLLSDKVNYKMANILNLQEDIFKSKIKFDQLITYIQDENNEENIYIPIFIYYIMFEFKQKELVQLQQLLQYKWGDQSLNVLNNILIIFQDRKILYDSLKYLNCYNQSEFDSSIVKLVTYLTKEKPKLSMSKDQWNKVQLVGKAQDNVNNFKNYTLLFLGDLTVNEICQLSILKQTLKQDNKNLSIICNNIITKDEYCHQLVEQFKNQ